VNPPLRELLNLSQANIAYTVAATIPRKRGSKLQPFNKFVFDFKRAVMTEREKVAEDLHRFFGGNAKKG
tara:strand:- start:846 stop:1052 length:207 start_codon:yes stop_codon:yes gene_type:complete